MIRTNIMWKNVSLYMSINMPLLAKCLMYLRIWKGAVASPVMLINAPNRMSNRNYQTWNWTYQGRRQVLTMLTVDIKHISIHILLHITHSPMNKNNIRLKVQINYIFLSSSRLNHADNKISRPPTRPSYCVLSEHTEHLNYHSIGPE
jgi:hypothetical protein